MQRTRPQQVGTSPLISVFDGPGMRDSDGKPWPLTPMEVCGRSDTCPRAHRWHPWPWPGSRGGLVPSHRLGYLGVVAPAQAFGAQWIGFTDPDRVPDTRRQLLGGFGVVLYRLDNCWATIGSTSRVVAPCSRHASFGHLGRRLRTVAAAKGECLASGRRTRRCSGRGLSTVPPRR